MLKRINDLICAENKKNFLFTHDPAAAAWNLLSSELKERAQKLFLNYLL